MSLLQSMLNRLRSHRRAHSEGRARRKTGRRGRHRDVLGIETDHVDIDTKIKRSRGDVATKAKLRRVDRHGALDGGRIELGVSLGRKCGSGRAAGRRQDS